MFTGKNPRHLKFLFYMPLWFSPLRSFQYPHFHAHVYNMCVWREFWGRIHNHYYLTYNPATHTSYRFLFPGYAPSFLKVSLLPRLWKPLFPSDFWYLPVHYRSLFLGPLIQTLCYNDLVAYGLVFLLTIGLTLPLRMIHLAGHFSGPVVCLHCLLHSMLYSSVNICHGKPVAIHWK